MPRFNPNVFDIGGDVDTVLDKTEATTTFIRGKVVLNKFPLIEAKDYRIAFVGEAPGRDEEAQGLPFVGISGRVLTSFLTSVGIVREACFVGNIVQYRPPNNNIAYFYRSDHTELIEGLSQLKKDLQTYKPNIVVCLGKTSFFEASGSDKITIRRGYLFSGKVGSAFEGFKCIAAYHPAFILRQFSWSGYLLVDLIKAKTEGAFPELKIPQRNYLINAPCDVVVNELEKANREEKLISVDIEGYWDNLSCCSIASSGGYSFIVPFARLDGSHYWNALEEEAVWKAFITLLENPKVPKVWQNGLYDRFCLQYGYGIIVRGNVEDTMLKFWEWKCEFRRKLSVQASILTNEPYWKHERVGKKEEDEVEGH